MSEIAKTIYGCFSVFVLVFCFVSVLSYSYFNVASTIIGAVGRICTF